MLKNWWLNRITSFKINNKLRHFCGVAFIVLSTLCNGQRTVYTSGTNFITAYIDLQMLGGQQAHHDSVNAPIRTSIHIGGVTAGCATVEVPYLNFIQSVWVEKDSIVTIELPPSPDYTQETINQLGIAITCTSPMIVLQSNLRGQGPVITPSLLTDFNTASVVIPNQILSGSPLRIPFSAFEGSYRVHYNAPWFESVGELDYKILSADDNNVIEIFSLPGSSLGGSIPANTPYSITMDSLDVFKFRSGGYRVLYERPISFLTVTSISNLPFKVMRVSGYMAVFNHTQPNGVTYEDMKLHNYADTAFYMPPIAGNYGNQYSLMAMRDSTVLSFNGQFGIVLDSLEILDTCIVGEMKIQASNPMLGYLSPCPDRNTNSNWNSPFSVGMSSTNELIHESLFKTFDEPDSLNHYILSVVTKTAATNDFLLDGAPIVSSAFTPFIANPDWSWANIELETGTHKASSSSGFHAFHYTYYIHPNHPNEPAGFSFPSYGYTLGESTPYPQDSLSFKFGTEINELKPFSDFTNPTSLCLENTVFVQAGLQKNITWKYSFGDGTEQYQKIENGKASIVSHRYTQPGSYWLSITDSSGCYPGDSLLLKVEPSPKANFTYSTLASCEGTLVQLESLNSADSYNWQWETGSSTEENPEFTYSGQTENLDITLIVTSKGCSDTLEQSIDLSDQDASLILPNIFTPNGDGVNDQYCIENVEGFGECFSLTIYNRWGKEVFTTEDPNSCWNGSNVSPGVYFYVVQIGNETFKGNVTLMF
ncbi:gliding motility-associated C-terminal domain-containing protein [Owenweeksia hongkongensis]|uniref:T9SS type B sorting domain-containing protein n=1 Tax=Owenweeksia hongkongensis TaxID=253245 RepID=UPI003A9528EA